MRNATLTLSPNPAMTRAEMAAAGYLARYSGNTLHAYSEDLRLFFAWAAGHGVDVLELTRPQLELYGRYLEVERGNGPSTVHRRLTVLRGFYRLAAIDGYLERSPAEHLRLPKVYKDESTTLGLDRQELGAIVAAARASSPTDGALISLMGLLGLRVSEACSVRIEDTRGDLRGHRTLTLVGKGGKPATIPLPIPVARAIDAAAGDRDRGPLLLRADGKPMDRKAADRVVKRLAKRCHIDKKLTPHSLRHSFVTACLDAGVPLRDVQIAARHADPRMTARYDRARGNLDRHASYVVSAFIAGAA